jgi:hypothetical protein
LTLNSTVHFTPESINFNEIDMRLNKKALRIVAALTLALSSLAVLGMNQQAHAASLGQVFVRFDRMQTSTATTGTVCAQPATTATEASVIVTFPTGYTLGLASTFTENTTNLAWPTGGTAWPSIATATNVTGQAVTFPSGDLTVGTLYCFNWINSAAVTVSASATSSNLGTVTTQTSVPATIDTAQFATASLTNDQVVVTATVPSTFGFSLSGTSDSLGNLGTGSVTPSPTPRTATVNTNAKNGWMVWAKDTGAGLASAGASHTIASNCSSGAGTNATLSAGTEGYNSGVTSSQVGGTGTITVATPFVGGSLGKGGGLCTNYQPLATSNGSANTAVLTVTNNVAISSITPEASDYTDTITVVGAGLF